MKKMMIVLAGMTLFFGANLTSCADLEYQVSLHLADKSGREQKGMEGWLHRTDSLLNEANIENKKLKGWIDALTIAVYENSSQIDKLRNELIKRKILDK